MLGQEPPFPDDASVADVLARTGARAAVVTLDRDGTVLLERDTDEGFRTRAVPASTAWISGGSWPLRLRTS